MSYWAIDFTPRAQEGLVNLGTAEQKRVIKKLEWLLLAFDKITPLPLTGEWQGFFKLRVGDIRIIYKAEYSKSILRIYVIDWRDKVYKR
jgi:mRNA interferase RelE/StbE